MFISYIKGRREIKHDQNTERFRISNVSQISINKENTNIFICQYLNPPT